MLTRRLRAECGRFSARVMITAPLTLSENGLKAAKKLGPVLITQELIVPGAENEVGRLPSK
jgi:hypothetical protein